MLEDNLMRVGLLRMVTIRISPEDRLGEFSQTSIIKLIHCPVISI